MRNVTLTSQVTEKLEDMQSSIDNLEEIMSIRGNVALVRKGGRAKARGKRQAAYRLLKHNTALSFYKGTRKIDRLLNNL